MHLRAVAGPFPEGGDLFRLISIEIPPPARTAFDQPRACKRESKSANFHGVMTTWLIRTALLVLAACFFDQSEKASAGTGFTLLRQGILRPGLACALFAHRLRWRLVLARGSRVSRDVPADSRDFA